MSPDTATLEAPRSGANGAGAPSLPAGPFRPRPGVLAARALDAMALYDPRMERYLTLNPVATRIWEGLQAGEAPAGIVNRIATEYEVLEVQVRADVAAQLESWLGEGLIEPGVAVAPLERVTPVRVEHGVRAPAQAGMVELRIPSVFRCGLTIARVKRSLRKQKFEKTVGWIRALIAPILATEDADLERVRALEYAVAMAGAFYPGRAKCLEQSLALYLLARRQGVRVRYCQGMQLYPFEAHAWITYRGQVINDVPEHIKHFTTFPDQLP
jgi:transglutaminase superfamily protein/coenzyme PQQ synthesis protein D (PqqD)